MALASAKKAAESRQASNNDDTNLIQKAAEETVVAPHVPALVTFANPSNKDEQTPKKPFCCCFWIFWFCSPFHVCMPWFYHPNTCMKSLCMLDSSTWLQIPYEDSTAKRNLTFRHFNLFTNEELDMAWCLWWTILCYFFNNKMLASH